MAPSRRSVGQAEAVGIIAVPGGRTDKGLYGAYAPLMRKLADVLGRVVTAYRRGRLLPAIKSRVRPYVEGLKYLVPQSEPHKIILHCPAYVAVDQEDRAIIERIYKAYRTMKSEQAHAPRCYLPSSMWQKILDQSYASLNQDNLEEFQFFLTNFGAWETDLGVESTTLIRNYAQSFLKRRYLECVLYSKQLRFWKWFYNSRKPVSALAYPTVGNQTGAYIDDAFVGLGSFFNEIYGSLLSGLFDGMKRPVVAELGGGYGKLAYFTLRHTKDFAYVDFDLPETLCLAAYWLMRAFPGRRAMLYGEEEYSQATHQKYDLIFMPSWEISKLDKATVDLFMNKNSMGEMTKEAVENYLRHITRSTRYFFHMNHEIARNIYGNNEEGLLGYEYPVPMERFTLLFRYPDIGHLAYQGFLDLSMDIFIYLYGRKERYDMKVPSPNDRAN